MLSIDESSIVLNSASLCPAFNPSVNAREKLATTPRFRDIRAYASSRVKPPESATSFSSFGCPKKIGILA